SLDSTDAVVPGRSSHRVLTCLQFSQWLTDRAPHQIKWAVSHRTACFATLPSTTTFTRNTLSNTTDMAPISTTFSMYTTPTAFFEPSPTAVASLTVETLSAAVAATQDIYSRPVPTFATSASALHDPPNIGRQFLLYMAIAGGIFLMYAGYALVKRYLAKWGGEPEVDAEKKSYHQARATFRPPPIAVPSPSLIYGRAPILIPQERPAYISTNDIVRSSSRGFYG
ncbi:hypothetical protein C8R45DRAFT_585268, partial [Mycena sanguinolenta]